MQREPVAEADFASVALKTFSRHLWYLNEHLIGLAFFDTQIPATTKMAMISALEEQGTDSPPPRIKIDVTDIPKKKLSDFVTRNTRYFFSILKIPDDFLKSNPNTQTNERRFSEGL